MSAHALQALLKPVVDSISGKAIEASLAQELNTQFAHGSDWYEQVKELCQQGLEAGWACQFEAGGIKYGRVIKPSEELNNYSVDIVLMNDVVGPHHSHPNGEVDLVIPLNEGAAFDGTSEGWVVYPPESAHKPTVTGGEAFVIYLLPEGAISFTR